MAQVCSPLTKVSKPSRLPLGPAFFEDKQEEGKGFSRTAKAIKTAKTVMKATPLRLNPPIFRLILRQTIRNPEKGAFAKGAFARGGLRKFVANCAPNLRKIAGISFRTSYEGCAKLSQIRK